MTAVNKRLYYLMLSPSLGQEFAKQAGFSVPSEDVQEIETYEVISRWALITSTGLLEEILEAADWFCDLQGPDDEDEEIRDDLHRAYVSHSVALINKLLDTQKVMLVMHMDGEESDDE